MSDDPRELIRCLLLIVETVSSCPNCPTCKALAKLGRDYVKDAEQPSNP